MQKSFTLVEILVVTTIIGFLAVAGIVSYTQFLKQSRDARRKADVELIRSALEMYKSSNDLYPTSPVSPPGLPFGAALVDASGNTYMSKIPTDPKQSELYYYFSDGNTYTFGVHLESGSFTVCSPIPSCHSTDAYCNYCMGPYGQL
ncbi:hypothetical protein COY87_01955 [Candidatus Roizmanbacteria bacterium CG_4_10_14_0_8_um_filter_33_9]|uniref:Type II secretion system protein GspG C-terminal domain-containing protein n=1 Tax=Candidatus Roizmanbacteria bacterium CG_4_10_14_0_8_um_filter_33_9 TaxID=1974826 RepID=A0A2M7QJS1_9BACT|nr:MAG: hypothetical protein COY87_01955 [Candidatus Roizmanbacteria bacterium CG_4_10_14_0_8_um_filter_33_9]